MSRHREQRLGAPQRTSWDGMHLTDVVLGITVRPVAFHEVLFEDKLENQGVITPLTLLQAAVLLLPLQNQSSLTCEVDMSKLQYQRDWSPELIGAPKHRSTHLKGLHQQLVQLKMFTVFRDSQQIRVLHTLHHILHSVPQHILVQQCGNVADTTPQISK